MRSALIIGAGKGGPAADVVIANADLPYVYSRLLPPSDTARRLETGKYTSSALMFYWGVRKDAAAKDRKRASAQLLHHNVFLADHRYRESFERIFRDHALPDEPSFYVCAPTRTDPSFAPEGSDNLMVLVPVGHLDESRPQDWDALRRRARQVVLERLLAEQGEARSKPYLTRGGVRIQVRGEL